MCDAIYRFEDGTSVDCALLSNDEIDDLCRGLSLGSINSGLYNRLKALCG